MEKAESPRRARRRARLDELVLAIGSATQVARDSGTPKSHISAMQAGKRGMGDEMAEKLMALKLSGQKAASTPHQKTNEINSLRLKKAVLPLTNQNELFHVEKHAEFDGIEMGVFDSGVPYLSERGLSKMCGLDSKSLREMASNWPSEKLKPRGKQISTTHCKERAVDDGRSGECFAGARVCGANPA